MPELPPDPELLRRLRSGDRQAFALLVDAWGAGMRRLALAHVRTGSLADEVVQEAWLGVIRGLATFEGRSSLKTWVFRIVANRAMSRGEIEARSRPFSAFGEEDGEAVDADRFDGAGAWTSPVRPWRAEAAEQTLLNREMLAELRSALDALPPRQRAVVQLCDVDGVEPAEVCNLLGLQPTNQRVLLHRGRAALRATLERRFGETAPGSYKP